VRAIGGGVKFFLLGRKAMPVKRISLNDKDFIH